MTAGEIKQKNNRRPPVPDPLVRLYLLWRKLLGLVQMWYSKHAVLMVTYFEIMIPSIDAYWLEEQSYRISSRSDETTEP